MAADLKEVMEALLAKNLEMNKALEESVRKDGTYNKSALKRARKLSLEIAHMAKDFRKVSVAV